MAYETVQVSSTEEYFVEDRDQVHCRHGSYIGYPGGADYICGACEDGADTLITGVRADLLIRFKDTFTGEWGHWDKVLRIWHLGALRKFDALWRLVGSGGPDVEVRIDIYQHQYWGVKE